MNFATAAKEPKVVYSQSLLFAATMEVFDDKPPVFWNEEALVSSDETTNPCQRVRETCERYYLDHQTHVTIHDDSIVELADRMIQEQQQIGSTAASLEWDDEHWHYRNRDDPERTALYILALDAINFCFWPSEHPYEYVDLATSLTGMVMAAPEQPPPLENSTAAATAFVLSAQSLQSMTPTRMRELFTTHHDRGWYPPNLDERCRLWNEVGQVLMEHYDGSCLQFIAAAENSAVALVRLLVQHLAGFRDHLYFGEDETDTDAAASAATNTTTTSTTTNSIHFYKRAQICVGDWNAALDLHLPDLDQLTTFADYRVPQLLRHLHVLTYDDALAALVDAQTELPACSAMECAIRSATVVAVERLVVALRRRQEEQPESSSSSPSSWNATTTDWYLWQVGEKLHQQGVLAPHHRVRTIYY
jgi:hypothetical protein